MERRTFLARIVHLFTALAGMAFAAPVFSFLRTSLKPSATGTFFPIGSTDQLQDDVTQLRYTRLVRDGWMVRTVEEYVWIRKKDRGELVIFEPHCTHLGCAYDWDARTRQFLCPCHGGKFDKDGKRTDGPPPRDLDRFEVRIHGKEIRVGKVVKA